MKVFGSFYLFAFLLFGILGFWGGLKHENPTLQEQVIIGVEAISTEQGAYLRYSFADGKFAAFGVPGGLTKNYAPPRTINGVISDVSIDPELFTILAGTVTITSMNSLAKQRRVTRFFNRLSGKSNTQRWFGTIVGVISGYSVGFYTGTQWALAPDSNAMLNYLAQEPNWQNVIAAYSVTKIKKDREAIEDLPEHVYSALLPLLEKAEQEILKTRNSEKASLKAELEILSKLDGKVKKHFGPLRSYWDLGVQDVINQFKFTAILVLGILAIILVGICISVVRGLFDSDKTD